MAGYTATRALPQQEPPAPALADRLRATRPVASGAAPLHMPAVIMERLAEAWDCKDRTEQSQALDRLWHAAFGQMTTGFSPAALTVAYTDWLAHRMMAPCQGRQLMMDYCQRWGELYIASLCALLGVSDGCAPEDKRFHQRYTHPGWQRWPYNMLAQTYLSMEDWWDQASRIRGMSEHHQHMVAFLHRLYLSALSPENMPFLNPEIQERTFAERGMNYLKGISNGLEDMAHWWRGEEPPGTHAYQAGKQVAVTKGKVVFRNPLFELIQYAPQSAKAYPEPVLIIPAWIMKYYILDLSPHNSMVRYLVQQGHTVFMMSWKNPDDRYRDVGFTDYLKEGALAAMDVVRRIVPDRKIHAAGYCIGGTLLAMTAAHLANQHQERLQTITLFAAQTDFSEAGQLMTFIDEAQVTYLEDIMFSQGFLRGDQLSSAFDLLRPQELIWQKMAQHYLLGDRPELFDLLAWNEDATRLPYRMHSEYLHQLYLHNQLADGEFMVDDETLDLDNIETPMFVVSTEEDHIAPWKSVYKIMLLTDAEITFVLANRGHNGGILSAPGKKGRHFRMGVRPRNGCYIPPHKWMPQQGRYEGSWWPSWHQWLASHSGRPANPPAMGAPTKGLQPIADAPGAYVHEH